MMEGSIASKIHAAKVDQKYPSFRVLSCHQVVKLLFINIIIAIWIRLLWSIKFIVRHVDNSL
jgi:hypothetical protein